VNRTLLAELQRHRSYPSITLLFNTTPKTPLSPAELSTANGLADEADRRLQGEIDDELRASLREMIAELIRTNATDNQGQALAVCVSPNHRAAVQLGRHVDERVIIDETFATRDLVADLNRTALYRVVTISDRTTRLFIGDRQRLLETRTDPWPLARQPGQTPSSWTAAVVHAIRQEHATFPLPTVVAGVDRSLRQVLRALDFPTIGAIGGNHDRTSWVDLHHHLWPLVTDWLRDDHARALQQLDEARSRRCYAGGMHEIWALANQGRIEMLVVEDTYAPAARVNGHHLEPTDDVEAPGVVDDIVDEAIEIVMSHGGTAVIVADGTLKDHERIAAIVRY
jgi:hypothetical protein